MNDKVKKKPKIRSPHKDGVIEFATPKIRPFTSKLSKLSKMFGEKASSLSEADRRKVYNLLKKDKTKSTTKEEAIKRSATKNMKHGGSVKKSKKKKY